MKLKFFLATLMLSLGYNAIAQSSLTESYINEWYKVAIAEMEQYGIPASITLAQGILESGSGQSFLATEANNHFGIKCHLDWDGRRVYYDDDEDQECFRKYRDAEDSYRDHSLFLKNRSRYAALFEESPADYKAWAKGLKDAGYATDRKYAKRLIKLIERYDLHKYDTEDFEGEQEEPAKAEELPPKEVTYILSSDNMVDYVIAKEGDTFESIAEKTGNWPSELLEYNELRYDVELQPGEVVYLQPKRKKADYDYKTHVVQEGESMYSISQKYAVRLEELYGHNKMKVGEKAIVGQTLKLR